MCLVTSPRCVHNHRDDTIALVIIGVVTLLRVFVAKAERLGVPPEERHLIHSERIVHRLAVEHLLHPRRALRLDSVLDDVDDEKQQAIRAKLDALKKAAKKG